MVHGSIPFASVYGRTGGIDDDSIRQQPAFVIEEIAAGDAAAVCRDGPRAVQVPQRRHSVVFVIAVLFSGNAVFINDVIHAGHVHSADQMPFFVKTQVVTVYFHAHGYAVLIDLRRRIHLFTGVLVFLKRDVAHVRRIGISHLHDPVPVPVFNGVRTPVAAAVVYGDHGGVDFCGGGFLDRRG